MTKETVIKRISRNVYTDEEMADLQEAVKQDGGKVIGITSMQNGTLSVIIDVDADKV